MDDDDNDKPSRKEDQSDNKSNDSSTEDEDEVSPLYMLTQSSLVDGWPYIPLYICSTSSFSFKLHFTLVSIYQ